MHRCTSLTAAAALSAAAVFFCACAPHAVVGAKTDKDDLRRERAEAIARAERAEAERDELAAKLAEAERARDVTLDREILAAIPRVAEIKLTDPVIIEQRDGTLTILAQVRPADGRRRFVQAVGNLSIELIAVAESLTAGSPEPARLGLIQLSPTELRDAYRSGVGGTGYEVRFTGIDPARTRGRSLLLRAELLDLVTGKVHRTNSPDE